jgi:hypothetical protein
VKVLTYNAAILGSLCGCFQEQLGKVAVCPSCLSRHYLLAVRVLLHISLSAKGGVSRGRGHVACYPCGSNCQRASGGGAVAFVLLVPRFAALAHEAVIDNRTKGPACAACQPPSACCPWAFPVQSTTPWCSLVDAWAQLDVCDSRAVCAQLTCASTGSAVRGRVLQSYTCQQHAALQAVRACSSTNMWV